MAINKNSWMLGFFEGQASFAVNIGLTKTLNKRYVVFKPYITIANVDKTQVDFIVDNFKLLTKVSKNKNETFSLNIQNFDDIDKILNKLIETEFISSTKQDKFLKFIECYEEIKSIGHIQTKWSSKFTSIIDKKLKINKARSNIVNNRFGKDEWVKRIKEHFSF